MAEGFVETSWRLWAADRSTTGPPRRISHLKQVQHHHTSTVPYSKINRHRVPAGRLGPLTRSGGGRHRVHGYATVMPKLCHAMPAREGTLSRAPGGRCRAAWQLQRDTNKAHQQQAVRSRPTDTWSHGQTTLSGDFLGHMQGRGMGLSARREVGDSPAEGDESQGSCRSDSWTMQKHADGCGTRTQPPQCLRVGSLQHCQLHSLQNEAKPMRETGTIGTHAHPPMPDSRGKGSQQGRCLGRTADIKTVSTRAEPETVFWPNDSWGAVEPWEKELSGRRMAGPGWEGAGSATPCWLGRPKPKARVGGS